MPSPQEYLLGYIIFCIQKGQIRAECTKTESDSNPVTVIYKVVCESSLIVRTLMQMLN